MTTLLTGYFNLHMKILDLIHKKPKKIGIFFSQKEEKRSTSIHV